LAAQENRCRALSESGNGLLKSSAIEQRQQANFGIEKIELLSDRGGISEEPAGQLLIQHGSAEQF
jgi:hypothetical protein